MTRMLYFGLALLASVYLNTTVQAADAPAPQCLSEACAQQLMETIDFKYLQSASQFSRLSTAYVNAELLVLEELLPFVAQMQKFDWQHFASPLLRRQFEVLLRELKYVQTTDELKIATVALKAVGKNKYVYERQSANDTEHADQYSFVRHIKPIITESNDLEELKWYWAEWRNKMPAETKDALHYYIEYYRNMSTAEMPPSAVWYDQYEDPNFMAELEQVMEEIAPLYRQLQAHLRKALRENYGDAVIPASGLIPHHLMEQALFQSWKKESILQNPFPQRKLPNMKKELDGMGFAPLDFVNISTRFFGSMGFERLTDNFIHEHFRLNYRGMPDCKSILFTTGEIHMKYCSGINYKKLLTTHGDVAHIEYAILKNNMRVGLSEEACPGFGNALGEATILSASTPKHLQQRLGLLLDYEYDDQLNLNFLYRMAVHALLSIPTYFVYEKLWVDMIDKKVTPEQYNCHYWNLMEKYMGVAPSVQTQGDAYDMPYKFYEGLVNEVRSTKKLFGEFLGYQIYRDICLEIGEYQRGNAQKTLQKCDFSGSRHAGHTLKNMMTAGSTKSWREIIADLTPNHNAKLQGSAFLDYYEPLQTWLTKDNAAKNLQVGWKSVNDCKSSP